MPSLLVLFSEWYYILMLGTVLVLSFYARKYDVFQPLYAGVSKVFKSKRAVIAVTSAISGVLPINGRVVVSAGILNTIAPSDAEKRKKYAIIDYLATHHFYFWSPLEQTVIVPMAALHISYWTFLGRTWAILATAITCALWYIFGVLKEDDVEINFRTERVRQDMNAREEFRKGVKTLALVTGLLMAGNFVGYHHAAFEHLFNNAQKTSLLIVVLLASFAISWLLGSSEKFSGLIGISAAAFGLQYLPLLFAVNWGGYFLSPLHKCMLLGRQIFGASLKDYYKVLVGVVAMVIMVAIVHTYTTGL
jgi:hypothetical protein